MKPYEKLLRYWQASDSGIQPADLDNDAVVSLERRYGITAPGDFRDYLRHCSPTALTGVDSEVTQWWTLVEIGSVAEKYDHELANADVARDAASYLLFADAFMWTWAWAIGCGQGANHGRILVIDGGKDRFVADSFAQFIDLYVTDPALLVG